MIERILLLLTLGLIAGALYLIWKIVSWSIPMLIGWGIDTIKAAYQLTQWSIAEMQMLKWKVKRSRFTIVDGSGWSAVEVSYTVA